MRKVGLVLVFLFAFTAPLAAQTAVNPTKVEFTASSDHDVVVPDVGPVLTRYELRIYLDPTSVLPVTTYDLGKPAPVAGLVTASITSVLVGLPVNTRHVARVAAIGPGGETASEVSNPFALIAAPGATGVPAIKK